MKKLEVGVRVTLIYENPLNRQQSTIGDLHKAGKLQSSLKEFR